jgi:hypothetical protein
MKDAGMTFRYDDNVRHANLIAYSGRDFVYTFMPKFQTLAPKNLLGANVWMQFRHPKTNVLLFEFKEEDLTLVVDSATASIIASASYSMTAAWTFKEAKYDLVIQYADGGRFTEFEGTVFVKQGVTQINE